MRSHSLPTAGLLALLGVLAAGLFAGTAVAATRPQVRVLGFTTEVRLGIPAVQAKPGKTLTNCLTRPPDNRDFSVVWSGRGISKGTRVGVALWSDNTRTGFPEPTIAEMTRSGFKWPVRAEESRTDVYGYTFGAGPFGPQEIDGRWTVRIALAGRVVLTRSVTVACQ